jgi:predicted DNA-binding transcriptional regulator AlpA
MNRKALTAAAAEALNEAMVAEARTVAAEALADPMVSGDTFAAAVRLARISALPREAFVYLPDVSALTGLPDTAVRFLVARGEFPEPVRLDGRRLSFVLGEVLDWRERVAREKRSREMRPDLQSTARKAGAARGAVLRRSAAREATATK